MNKTEQLTIRGITPQTKVRLEQAARKNGVSLNKYLQQQLNNITSGDHRPSLKQYMLTSKFSIDDSFDATNKEQRIVEPKLWQD